MFNLSKHQAKLSHLNLRKEPHGDVEVTMADLRWTLTIPNVLLDDMSPHLRVSLYRGDDPDLLGIDPGHTPKLRHPDLGKLRWGGNYDIELTLHLGARKKDDYSLSEVKLNAFVIDPMDGGTVGIVMRSQFAPTEEQVAKLAMLLGHEFKISTLVLDDDQRPPPEPDPDDQDQDEDEAVMSS